MSFDVSIVDYGVGNIYSIKNALANIGFSSNVVSLPEDIQRSEKLILPGVGAFPHAINKLKSVGISDALAAHVKSGKPLLGICLGMQLLFDESDEFGNSRGLGFLRGKAMKFLGSENYCVPQIQWNRVESTSDSKLLDGVSSEFFYFLHSFYVDAPESTSVCYGVTDYADQRYVSLVEKENVIGVQFHPERSGLAGLRLLDNFMKGF